MAIHNTDLGLGGLKARSLQALLPPSSGSQKNPAESVSNIRNWYEGFGQSPSNGVYWFQRGNVSFQTYCLFDEMDGNDWVLMFNVNVNDGTLQHNSPYWNDRNALNVSPSFLDYKANTSTNVATDVVNHYPFRDLAVTNYRGNGDLDTYYLGSASNNKENLLSEYTSQYIATEGKVGGGSLSMPWGNPTTGTGGNRLMFNQQKGAQSGTAYARFGQAQAAEPYNSVNFTHRYYGVGAQGNHCNGSYTRRFDFGQGSGRHSASGCSDNPSSNGTFEAYEMWVR